MQDVLQARIWSEVDAVGLEGGGRKAWHEVDPVHRGQHGGELGEDLRQAFAIPDRLSTVHGSANQNLELRPSRAKMEKLAEKVLDNGLDTKSDGGGMVSRSREEVGDACHHKDVALLPDRGQGFREDLDAAAGEMLSTRHQGTVTTVQGTHVTPEVRIPDQSEDARLRHVCSASSITFLMILHAFLFPPPPYKGYL